MRWQAAKAITADKSKQNLFMTILSITYKVTNNLDNFVI